MPSKLSSLGPRLQVGALPWRQSVDGIEVLLVTSRLSRHWLIPKGWLMKGKTAAEAAAREALEEAGVRGTISGAPIARYSYDKLCLDRDAIPCVVDVYPLRVDKELNEWQESTTRTRSWMPLETASMLAYEEGLSALLASLDQDILTGAMPVPQRKKAAKR
jgi:8-oxo-dGTP pyrophosphatase MutT (NUDIX family)